ncbi:MAG: YceI family protein [Steroidobacteraceae bacterium]
MSLKAPLVGLTAPFILAALGLCAAPVLAAPVTYQLDPSHTYVSFAAPHIQAISYWRGKFNRTESGTVTLDPAAHKGSIEVVIDASSIDVGFPALTEELRGPQFLDSAKYPTATYRADVVRFKGDKPVEAVGKLTLHGVTKPVRLKIDSFKCIADPFAKNVERCGANASAVIDRSAFGVSEYAKMTGSQVRLEIQVEGTRPR